MNPSSLTPEKLRALLQLAGRRLGATPEQLEDALKSGSAEPIASKLSPDLTRKVNDLLSDREQMERLLASPQVQSFLQSRSNT